jgi:hypothetical protein
MSLEPPAQEMVSYPQLGFFASPSAVWLLVPTKNDYAPLAAYEFWQVFRLANLFNPTAHIGFAGDLNAYRFAIAYSQYVKYME